MPIATLPNGVVLETPTENEAKIIYYELFESNAYLRNGISLHDGATVFDVGAHVGGFSASLVQHHRDLRLFLLEPIPETFAILERNAERLRAAAQVISINAAVSSAPGRIRFRVDPSSSFVASAVTAVTQAEVNPDLLTRTRALAGGRRAGGAAVAEAGAGAPGRSLAPRHAAPAADGGAAAGDPARAYAADADARGRMRGHDAVGRAA